MAKLGRQGCFISFFSPLKGERKKKKTTQPYRISYRNRREYA